MLAHYLRLLNEALATMRETLVATSADQSAIAKELAERTLTKGADYVAKQLELAGSKAAAQIGEATIAAEKAWRKEAAIQRRLQNRLVLGLIVINAILACVLVSLMSSVAGR